jgi:hypothetical protein
MGWLPMGVLPATLMVRAWLTGAAPVTFRLVGVRTTPVGAFTRLKMTPQVKPCCGVRVRVVVRLLPWDTVWLVGLRLKVKPGVGGEAGVQAASSGARASTANSRISFIFFTPFYARGRL